MKFRFLCLLALLLSIVAAGCGGGGGAGLSAGAGTKGLFLTSGTPTSGLVVAPKVSPQGSSATSLGTYDHVWVTIKQVIFDGSSGAVTAYSDPAGTVVDLKTLKDVSGAKFSFLGSLNLSSTDTYTDFKVVLDKGLTLVPAGQTTGVAGTFVGFDAGTNLETLTFTFAAPKKINGDFCVDFDIDNWTVDGSNNVTAVIGEHDGTGLDNPSDNIPHDFHGVLGALAGTAPTQTFTLTAEEGFQVTVTTTATTNLFISDGSANPTLANGQHVVVTGAFDVTTHTLAAGAVLIVIGNGDGEQHASGVPSNGDAGAGTFTLAVSEADGFVPQGANITIATTGTTKFFSDSCVSLSQADFFAALATASGVHVNGAFDANTQTLTALSIRLEGGDDAELAIVAGAVSNGNAAASTFDIAAHEFEGLNIAQGAIVHIKLGDSPTLLDGLGNSLTAPDFFTALATAHGAVATGTYDAASQTLTASRVKLFSAPNVELAEMIGAPSNVNADTKTFTITVSSWHDADLTFGQQLAVTVDANTVYKGVGGDIITADAFFAGLGSAPSVSAAGIVSNGGLAAKYLKLNN